MFGLNDQDEEDDFANIPAAPVAPVSAPEAAAPPPMNPTVRDYLLQRKAERDAMEKSNADYDARPNVSAALAAIGAGFQGKDSLAAGQSVVAKQQADSKQKLADFDSTTDRTTKDDTAIREGDVNSEESKMANELAKRMGYKGAPVSATQFKSFSPALEKMYAIEEKKLDRQDARDERRFQSGIKMNERKEEKEAKLTTPFGLANTEDDAKKLKEAYESKKNFDNKINEMIQLRKDNHGGALLNREDVARGAQLSKDLLLEYKNMAKLGVLSVSDEKILNKIIPADPLEYNSPLAAIQGQDPILNNLEQFKGDSDKDFQTRLQTRIRGGAPADMPKGKDTKVVGGVTYKKVPGGWEEVESMVGKK